MADYLTDRQWSDRFIPTIKRIVGPHLLEPADFARDASEATDLIVLTARDMRIAARIRRPGYAERYGHEFTIRARRDTGAETELSKVVDGWGDWLFYGHASVTETSLQRWMIVNLHAFRAALIRDRGSLRRGDKPNGDGTYFKWFDVHSFPKKPPILIADSHNILSQEAA